MQAGDARWTVLLTCVDGTVSTFLVVRQALPVLDFLPNFGVDNRIPSP